MASREPLAEKERRQVQWAYHKRAVGVEARKKVIQELFGRDISRASCLAKSEYEILSTKAYARSITEFQFWDLLCCAAYHNKIWELPSAEGDIRKWIHSHCSLLGDTKRYEGTKHFEAYTVPPPIPGNWKIEVYGYGSLAIRNTAKLIGPVLIFILGYFFRRIADSIFS